MSLKLPIPIGSFASVRKDESKVLIFGGKTVNDMNKEVFLVDVVSSDL